MKKIYIIPLLLIALLSPLLLFIKSAEAACAAPATNMGSATSSQNISTAGRYRIWSRIMVPDSTNNSFFLEIDGNACLVIGDNGSIPANTWTWVSYKDGNTSSLTDMDLSAGQHAFKMIGREAGVKVDRVIFTADLTCTPSNTKDANGQVGTNCASPPDTTAPSVDITAPISGSTQTGTVNVTVNSSDDTGGSGVARVELSVGTAVIGSDTTSPYSFSVDTTQLNNGANTLTARAFDVAGNMGLDTSSINVQNSTVDTQAPTVPTCPSATALAYNSIDVDWCASTDNEGVTGYYVQRNGITIAQVTGTRYADNTVLGSTAYTYKIAAYDAAGNTSAFTEARSATTPAAPDTQAPTAPSNLAVTLASETQANLSWTASIDNIGVKEYEIYRSTENGAAAKVATTSATSYGDPGLAQGTLYGYYVVAVDASGNRSPESATKSVTTPNENTVFDGNNIVGRIADSKNKPIPGSSANILVNGIRKSYATGAQGYFITEKLPVGVYRVSLEAPGYVTRVVNNVNVQVGDTTSIKNIKLTQL